VYLRLNLGCETPEVYRFQGSKGILEVTENTIAYFPQNRRRQLARAITRMASPHEMRAAYYKKWHAENDPALGKEPVLEGYTYKGDSWGRPAAPHVEFFCKPFAPGSPLSKMQSSATTAAFGVPHGQRILFSGRPA